MNYTGLTARELINLAETDEGAQRYIATNARLFMDSVERYYAEINQHRVDEAGSDGWDRGTAHERQMMRDCFETKIESRMNAILRRNNQDPDGLEGEDLQLYSLLGDMLEAIQ